MTITVSCDERGVATVTLDRPDVHNALEAATMDALTAFARAPDARVVVLTGAGASFCAGGDLRWMRAQFDATPEGRRREAERLAHMLGALDAMDVPLVARVNGAAFGGGVGMACVADVAVASQEAKFGLTETRLGLIPATIGPYVVGRMGEGRARQVFMSSRRFGADEAVRLGIVARAVPAADLDAAVEAEVAPYLACAPGAVRDAKRLARMLGGSVTEDTVARSIDALMARWEDPEAREGVGAFFDRRKPDWSTEG
ncbi:crotonase/enoyl-CoA hydratase family protein [Jannaschia sp. W003]|uniref:crotonase/enoyl-CoA hydratase family protein n=1 Tax=Jannaschia sp. W003 TaxID=2867012 RepID=UPI0021A5F37B|nr:crotonase/enoyl-CoA hydratase family protein [Jannaschia sp. W003]UWQ22820.1 crotonase/enoyl-CoA hydratase family protein [Jannaschia sp. W003]